MCGIQEVVVYPIGVQVMEFADVVKSRRGVRSYRDAPIPEAKIEQLLDIARHAPSSMNGQPWHFVVIKKYETKKSLVEIKNKYCPPEKQAFPADFLEKAPVILVVCVEKTKSFGRDVENAVLAASCILLGAHSIGLGSVYLSAYMASEPRLSEEIRRELNIPAGISPISILPLGYPNEIPRPKELRELKEMIHLERF
jgi:nitroreductase